MLFCNRFYVAEKKTFNNYFQCIIIALLYFVHIRVKKTQKHARI